MGEDTKSGNVTIACSGMADGSNVHVGDGREELTTESLVNTIVGLEDFLAFKVQAVDFGDLGACRSRGVLGLCWWIGRSDERDVVGQEKVLGGWNGEGEMSLETVAQVGMNGRGIAVNFGLRYSEARIGRSRLTVGDGSECGEGEGGDDADGSGHGWSWKEAVVGRLFVVVFGETRW